MMVEHITYNRIEGEYDSSIFTVERVLKALIKRLRLKAIQDYVFTDGTAEESIERKFALGFGMPPEVCVYAKLPRGFSIFLPLSVIILPTGQLLSMKEL